MCPVTGRCVQLDVPYALSASIASKVCDWSNDCGNYQVSLSRHSITSQSKKYFLHIFKGYRSVVEKDQITLKLITLISSD